MNKTNEYLSIVDDVINKGRFKDNWESLSQFKIPGWYREKRFGIFIHWGVFSVPATESEWYPRLMYKLGTKSNLHHKKTYGMNFEYRNLVELFKPDKFNSDEWADIFKKSGAGYIMPVGEHHDGIKMYESSLNKWNMMNLNGRDYMAELHCACDKAGLGFLISNHRAEHFWFFNTARKYYPESEAAKNMYPDLYGPAFVPESGNVDKTDKEIFATEDYLKEWLASACEMIDKNKPLAVYFDWWIHKDEFRPYLKKFLAYYYNRGVEWGKEVCVFYKWGAVFNGCAVFDVERGQINGVSGSLWQNDTAIAKNSWGYTNGNRFKTPAEIIRNMIEVFAKNGCYMLNVGPKANGEICEEEKSVLLEIGKWLQVNGEAVYGSYPFEVAFSEGKKSKNGAFKENKKFSSKDFYFTEKPGKIFVFPMGENLPKTLKIKSLRRANEGGIRYKIEKIHILGTQKSLNYTHNQKRL
ncbi:MAG: alpha-L-fucosidase [Clostridiales bacterium]|nr:alpha-L-fucosidase [Clostridiales bacterium]